MPGLLEAAAGRLLQRELESLEHYLADPAHPYVAVLGGAKVSSKLGVLRTLAARRAAPNAERPDELIALDEALTELARINPRQASMVEARFFGGLETRETAALVGVAEATLRRDWCAAKAWLSNEVRRR